jgi:beta-glucanase (GH16 family)
MLTDLQLADLFETIRQFNARQGEPKPPVPGDWTLTFREDFTTNSHRWDTVYPWNKPTGRGGALVGNSPLEWNLNHRYGPTAAIEAWDFTDGLSIIADHMPSTLKPHLGYTLEDADVDTLGKYDYTSACFNSAKTFNQRYGYFEAVLQCPEGRGLWPAFWLRGEHTVPEIDILEILGHEPTRGYTTLHYMDGDVKRSAHIEAWAEFREWRKVGLLWTPELLQLYIDDKPAGGGPIPNYGAYVPMSIYLNLAVGGSWPGPPDKNTIFPAVFGVRDLRVWQRADLA